MSNNPAYQTINPNSGALPAGVIVETEQQPSGAQRQVVKIAPSEISTLNSTSTPLGINEVFTGAWVSTLDFSEVIVSVKTDKASITNGLVVQWSADGVIVDEIDDFTVAVNTGKTWSFPCNRAYVRVVYTNDGVAQTVFSLQTVLRRFASKGSSHRLEDALNFQDDGIVTKSLIAGKTTAAGSSIVDVKVNPSGALTVDASGAAVTVSNTITTTRADDLYNDAFQRLRVSQTDQRFDSEFLYDKSPLLFDDISAGGGSATFDGNSRDVLLATGGAGVGVVAGLRQHFANIYTSGNSQFIILTGTLASIIAGGRAEIFLRSNVTGIVTEQVADQSVWAVTSGIDWTKSHIFIMDFQSLRVGRIRWGLDVGGIAIPMAQITNDNIRATGYWQCANQPVYWRQFNTASYTYTEIGYGDEVNAIGFRYRVAVNAAQTMRAICSTVKSEGGGSLADLAGIRFAAANGITKRSVTSTTAFLPVLSIQLKSTLNTYPVKSVVFPKEIEIATDNPVYYEVRVNPALTGAAFTSMSADSVTNYDVTATAITGGRVIKAGYVAGGQAGIRGMSSPTLTSKIPLGVTAAGVGDILSICFVKDGQTNAAVSVSLVFEEIR